MLLSGESRDGGPTATSSHSRELHGILLVAKCVRCDEEKVSTGPSERRQKQLRWLLEPPEAPIENEPTTSGSPESGPVMEKHHVGFHWGLLKEDARPGPLCTPCFRKETVGKTTLYIAFWYLANALLEAYKTSKIGDRMAKFPAPRLLQALFFITQAVLSGLLRLTKWGKKPSPIAGISWNSYFLRVVPPGIANAIDINIAIAHPSIPDDFKYLSKSGAPFVALLMTYAFHLEAARTKLTVSMASFTAGTLLTVGNALGHATVLSEIALLTAASVVIAFRWTGTQILLQREILHMSTPFSTMRVMKPVAAILTLVVSYFTESWGTVGQSELLDTKLNIMLIILVAAGGLALATVKSVAELMLLARTSSLTYIVLLLLKDVGHVLEKMIHEGWGSFFENRDGVEGSMKQETMGFLCIIFGLGLFCWERYQQWSFRGRRRSQFVPLDQVQKEEIGKSLGFAVPPKVTSILNRI